MKRSRGFIAPAAVALLTLVGAAPPHHLPPCINSAFEGITQTLGDGTIVGAPDARDWGCVDRGHGAAHGAAGNAALARGRMASDDPGTQAGVPVPPPTTICLTPAAPNPATTGTRLQFTLPAAAHVTLSVYGRRQGHGPRETSVVRTLLDGTMNAGTFSLNWDLSDDQFNPLPPGIYRVVLVVGDEALCGDLEVR